MDLNKELAKKARFDEKDRWIYRHFNVFL